MSLENVGLPERKKRCWVFQKFIWINAVMQVWKTYEPGLPCFTLNNSHCSYWTLFIVLHSSVFWIWMHLRDKRKQKALEWWPKKVQVSQCHVDNLLINYFQMHNRTTYALVSRQCCAINTLSEIAICGWFDLRSISCDHRCSLCETTAKTTAPMCCP